MPHNRANHEVRRPGETRLVSIGRAGEVRCLPQPCIKLFVVLSPRWLSALTWLGHYFQSTFLYFRFRLLPFCRCLTTMLPASLASNPNSSLALEMEGLCRNILAIRVTLPVRNLPDGYTRTGPLPMVNTRVNQSGLSLAKPGRAMICAMWNMANQSSTWQLLHQII